MGTERDEVFSGPCRCGKGTVQFDYCQPDHGWAQSHWYEHSISCKACDGIYVIQRRLEGFFYVEKTELTKLRALSDEAFKRANALMKHPKVKALWKEAAELLDNQPSVAAVHRLLNNQGFSTNSLATFRKHWRGGNIWLDQHVSQYSIDKLYSLMGVEDPQIFKEAAAIDQLLAASRAAPPHLPGLIYKPVNPLA